MQYPRNHPVTQAGKSMCCVVGRQLDGLIGRVINPNTWRLILVFISWGEECRPSPITDSSVNEMRGTEDEDHIFHGYRALQCFITQADQIVLAGQCRVGLRLSQSRKTNQRQKPKPTNQRWNQGQFINFPVRVFPEVFLQPSTRPHLRPIITAF